MEKTLQADCSNHCFSELNKLYPNYATGVLGLYQKHWARIHRKVAINIWPYSKKRLSERKINYFWNIIIKELSNGNKDILSNIAQAANIPILVLDEILCDRMVEPSFAIGKKLLELHSAVRIDLAT